MFFCVHFYKYINLCRAAREQKERISICFCVTRWWIFIFHSFLNPLNHGGRGEALYAPPSLAFCLLLKSFFRHPYLKILDLTNHFVADAPMKKKIRNLVLPPLRALWKMGLKTGYGLEASKDKLSVEQRTDKQAKRKTEITFNLKKTFQTKNV